MQAGRLAGLGVLASLCAGVGLWSPSGADAAQVLYVADTATPAAGSADANIIDRLRGAGHTVTVAAAPSSGTADAAGKDVVFVSSTIASGDVAGEYANVPAAVITWEQAIMQQSRQNLLTEAAARANDGAFTQVTITAAGASHPIAAGLPAGTRTVLNAPDAMLFGDTTGLGAGGVAVALRGDGMGAEATRASIIAYDTGGIRPDGTPSPGRRVAMFMDDDSFNKLTPDGLRLFDAASGYVGAVIPEPASLGLLSFGALGLLARRRRAA